MKSTWENGRIAAMALSLVLAGTGAALLAHAEGGGQDANAGYGYYGMGPGMMGGYGPGMMGGYGPGMMGGYGMGPGMMGGYGMGQGMMGAWAPGLDLTDAQQAKVNKIMDETRKVQWALMGAMMDQRAALRDLYASPKQDDAAIEQANKNFNQLRQQMFDNMTNAQKRIDQILTQEQREKLHRYWSQFN